MKPLTICFCDDDPLFRSHLRQVTEEAFARQGCTVFSREAGSARELGQALMQMEPELIFLDIDMPETDGIHAGEQLRTCGCTADIIYVSNMEDKVYEIFRVHPWSFIRKSRLKEEIDAVAAEYVRSRRQQGSILLLPGAAGTACSVDARDLVYVEAVGKNQKLFRASAREQILVRSTLHDLEQQLLPFGFIRIHKGFLVNYRFVAKITSRSVLLDTGGDIPIGRNRVKEVREKYLALMKWKGLNPGTGNY